MTLMQMRYFSTVCETRNISAAAQRLFISQPALSAALAEIEKEVGFQLFLRRSKGVTPTEEALLLLEQITAVLRRIELLDRTIPLISASNSVIRVGFKPYGGANDFFRIYSAFRKANPELRIDIHEMSNTAPWQYLDENQIDFLFLPTRFLPEGWLAAHEGCYCRIGTEVLSLYGNAQNPLTQKGVLTLEEFSALPLLFWDGHANLAKRLEKQMEKYHLPLCPIGTTPQISSILQAIYHDMAFGLLPGDFYAAVPGISPVGMPPEIAEAMGEGGIPIYVYWNKSAARYTGKKLFIDYLKSISLPT